MKYLQKFVEKAAEGGYKNGHFNCSNCTEPWLGHKQTRIGNRYCALLPDMNALLLDPLAWVAVGKSLGWKDEEYKDVWCEECGEEEPVGKKVWHVNMHRFIDKLCAGLPQDQALLEILA